MRQEQVFQPAYKVFHRPTIASLLFNGNHDQWRFDMNFSNRTLTTALINADGELTQVFPDVSSIDLAKSISNNRLKKIYGNHSVSDIKKKLYDWSHFNSFEEIVHNEMDVTMFTYWLLLKTGQLRQAIEMSDTQIVAVQISKSETGKIEVKTDFPKTFPSFDE